MRKSRALKAAVLAGALLAPAAHAATCTVAAPDLAFGSYNPQSDTARDAVGQVTVTCSNALVSLFVNYSISLSKGGAGSYAPRTMASGANTLQYNLYSDLLRTSVWGDDSAGAPDVDSGYLVGVIQTVQSHFIYGRIPKLQNAAAGMYSDTITVTINY